MLLKKYNIPGPRYTSYPTVPYWEKTPTQEEWLESVKNSLQLSRLMRQGMALYVHIPFCENLCTYCGCNTRITRKHEVGMPYIQTVLKEMALYSEALGKRLLPLSELHLGGGTPTFLSPKELEILITGLLKFFTKTEDAEFSIEVDPRVTTKEHLETLATLGFTRISMGIQDFDPKVQETVNRVQSPEQVKSLTEEARKLGFHSVNFDLIYGLPFQTLESIQTTFSIVSELKPDRIAYYAYAHVPWIKPSQRRFTEEDLPSGDEKRVLYETGRSLLEQQGYLEVGMDHFALPTDSLWIATESTSLHRNFMGYISRLVSPLIGLGVSAISDSWQIFSQNEKHLESYVRRVEKGEIPILRGHILNDEDLILRKHILNLMTQFRTSWKEPNQMTEILKDVPEKLSELSRDGLVRLSAHSCHVTEKGKPFLRNICMAFDARLSRKAPETRLFSQTI